MITQTVASNQALTTELLAARAQALFTSDLSVRREYTQTEVATAIKHAIGSHNGIRGCAGEVAAAYGEHPETAARRMREGRSGPAKLRARVNHPRAQFQTDRPSQSSAPTRASSLSVRVSVLVDGPRCRRNGVPMTTIIPNAMTVT
jgi:type IV secretory pathway TrbL component